MQATRSSIGESDRALLRACYELIRHVNHPRRLASNPIATRLFGGTPAPPAGEEARLVAILADAVRNALAEIPARRRTIVQRCDLNGEQFASVAHDLNICERHLFRERRAAIVELAARLIGQRPVSSVPSDPQTDVATELAFAARLEHNGHWRTAADILEALRKRLPDAQGQCRVAMRLAALYREAGRLSMASHHAAFAKSLARASGNERLAVRADVAVARIAAQAGKPRGSRRVLERSSRLLRLWASGERHLEVAEALVDSLELTLELAHARGDIQAVHTAGLEMLTILSQCDGIDPSLEITARSSASIALIYFERDAPRIERELQRCYVAAVHHGLTRQAIVVATSLAIYFRLQERAADALELLEPLLERARIVAVGDSRGGFFCELMSACIETGALSKAAEILPDLRESAAANPALRPAADLVAANLYLARRSYSDALESAEAAETGYLNIGCDRMVGAALRLQAESLAGIGRTEQAAKVASMAVESLRKGAHPKRLAAAYETLASITGQRRHRLVAQKLREEC